MKRIPILLVEDEPSLNEMYAAIFRNSPYELVNAKDKATSLKVARELKPLLILLDIILPEAEGKVLEFSKRVGFELLRELRKDSVTKDILVLILTNLDSPEDRAMAQRLGVNSEDYLIKANMLPREVVETVSERLSTVRKKQG